MKQVHYDTLAPVALFTYKRLSTTRLALESLLANDESSRTDLFVFSDGPKGEEDQEKVDSVRKYIETVKGFRSITLIKRRANLGLAQSFITGITNILERHDAAIFLEDDNIVSSQFLNYMNNCLVIYKDNSLVSCVSGYSWPVWPNYHRPYFLKGAETWSMATWRRSWRDFEPDGKILMRQVASLKCSRQIDSYGQDYMRILQDQIDGKNDSWGVRWWISAYLKQRVCLYPHKPLVVIADPGNESTHCTGWSPLFRRTNELAVSPIICYPRNAKESPIPRLLSKTMNMTLRIRDLSAKAKNLILSPPIQPEP